MKIAVVGCGFVADYYMKTLPNHPQLEVAGVMDRDGARAAQFGSFYGVTVYRTLDELLADREVAIVLNLTNPRSHFAVTDACLRAGKHVYSEKPIATDFTDAEKLVRLAEERGLRLTSAPCNVLSETAQTVAKALREGEVGRVRLAYAELDDGLVHRMRYRKWVSDSGSPWPAKDEFEVGCTLEHAGYYVTWLTAFFGPARRVTAFSACLIPDKETDQPLDTLAPDFSVGCIEFHSGVVARLTCSIVAPHDHRLRIIGDDGVLSVEECWNYRAPVYIKRRTRLALWAEKFKLLSLVPGIAARKYPLIRRPAHRHKYRGTHVMDFARGVAEMAASITQNRPSCMPVRWALHVNEIVLALQYPEEMGCPRELATSFDPLPSYTGPA
jgi:predicted dehydrogenase